MNQCEFCAEFQAEGPARFRSLYNGLASHRVVARTERFIAIPTLGQLLEGSLLVLPVAHVETCAALGEAEREELLGLVEQMVTRVRAHGSPVVFEHGATASSGGGCGIHHAHLHIVPLPEEEVATDLLFPEATEVRDGLEEAWRALQGSTHYLLLGDGRQVRVRDLVERPGEFPSQFFRRRIAKRFVPSQPWDWRDYAGVEPALLRVLKASAVQRAEPTVPSGHRPAARKKAASDPSRDHPA